MLAAAATAISVHMTCWMHRPLPACRLDDFAHAYSKYPKMQMSILFCCAELSFFHAVASPAVLLKMGPAADLLISPL